MPTPPYGLGVLGPQHSRVRRGYAAREMSGDVGVVRVVAVLGELVQPVDTRIGRGGVRANGVVEGQGEFEERCGRGDPGGGDRGPQQVLAFLEVTAGVTDESSLPQPASPPQPARPTAPPDSTSWPASKPNSSAPASRQCHRRGPLNVPARDRRSASPAESGPAPVR